MAGIRTAVLSIIPVLCGCLCSAAVTAETAETNIGSAEIRFNTGIAAGSSHEYVYDAYGSASGYKGYKISELIWEYDTVPMAGVGLSFPVGSMFKLNMDYWQNVGEGDSVIDDYDWLYVGADWSHWSHHNNTTARDVSQMDVNADFDLHESASGRTKLVGIVGYRQDHVDWQARGGYGIYSISTYRDSWVTFPNTAVGAYEQTFTTPYVGLGFNYTANSGISKFTLSGSMKYSQWVHAEDIDHHYLRDLLIKQSGDNGEWMGIDLNVGYDFTPEWALMVGLTYQKYSELKTSKTYTNLNTGVKTYYPGDSGGLSHTSHMMNVGVKYRF